VIPVLETINNHARRVALRHGIGMRAFSRHSFEAVP